VAGLARVFGLNLGLIRVIKKGKYGRKGRKHGGWPAMWWFMGQRDHLIDNLRD